MKSVLPQFFSNQRTFLMNAFFVFLLLFLLEIIGAVPVHAIDASNVPYKAIVKVNTYILNKYDNLSLWGSGSGIIIDESGIVLTNYHVTTVEELFDGSLRETAVQVCLTIDPNEESDCSYLGRVMARDKDLDIALLQLVPLSNMAKATNDFPYLQLSGSDSIGAGNKINVLGYPSIGDETITITEGIVSGKLNKYKKDWLKTDAVISLGNSGGAGVDQSGHVVGLTSQAHSDLIGTLGYLINISSINSWISSHIRDGAQAASFETSLSQLSSKQKEIKTADTFESNKPPYSVTKPHDWDFQYYAEDALFITKKEDNEGGSVTITTQPLPVRASTDFGLALIKERLLRAGYLGLVNDIKKTPVSINGLDGDKLAISAAGQTITQYLFSIDNYVIAVVYSYGKLDKDKVIIDEIIDSLRHTGNVSFEPEEVYSSTDPALLLIPSDEWRIMGLNSKTEKAELRNEAWPGAIAALQLVKIEAKESEITNEEKEKLLRDQITAINNASSVAGLKYTVVDSSPHFALNDEITDAIMVAVEVKKNDTDEILFKMIDHYIKQDGYFVDISFNMFTDRNKDFDIAFNGVKSVLSSLSLDVARATAFQQSSKEFSEAPTTRSSVLIGSGVVVLIIVIGGSYFAISRRRKQ